MLNKLERRVVSSSIEDCNHFNLLLSYVDIFSGIWMAYRLYFHGFDGFDGRGRASCGERRADLVRAHAPPRSGEGAVQDSTPSPAEGFRMPHTVINSGLRWASLARQSPVYSLARFTSRRFMPGTVPGTHTIGELCSSPFAFATLLEK